jgi:hypothetical protein
MKRFQVVVLLVVIALITASVQAAFIVEPHTSGKAFANFAGTPRYSVTFGTAIGLTATMSAYGSTAAETDDTYVFTYTLGTDADNTVYAAGENLGNNLASGLVGGGSSKYNVYATWPASASPGLMANMTVTNDGAAVLSTWNQATGQSGSPGGTNAWLLIAGNVDLTAGNSYTVTQVANGSAWTSMRSAGIMWEAVPEPATMALLGFGGLLLRSRRRR